MSTKRTSSNKRAPKKGAGQPPASKQKGWKQAWAAGIDSGPGNNPKITRPFEQSVWVFSAINHVAGPVSSIGIKWSQPGMGEAAPMDRERESFWNRPAVTQGGMMSRKDFVNATIIWMMLHGQAFWIMDDSWLIRSSTRSPLILARPDRMRAIQRGGQLLGWEYTDGGNQRNLLLPEQVARPRFFNPYDDLEGLAPWKAAEIAAQADYAAGVFAKNLMSNNGDRGAFVIAKSGVVNDAQRQQIETALRQKRELNRRGEARSLFLTGDITVEDPKVQSVDASFVSQRLQHRHEVYIAFGVPASMADIQASYSVGAASDRYRLIEETCMPVAATLAEAMEAVEARRSGADLQCGFDWSQHSVMRQVRVDQVKSAKELWTMGMPLKKAGEWLGLGLPDFEGSEQGYLPMSLQTVEEAEAPEEKPAADPKDPKKEDPAVDPEDEAAAAGEELSKSLDALAALMKQAPAVHAKDCPCCHGLPDDSGVNIKADDKRGKEWLAHMAARKPCVKRIVQQVNKALAEARAETLKNLEGTAELASVKKRGVMEIIFDRGKFELRMVSLLEGPLQMGIRDAVEQFNLEVGLDDPWTMPDPEVIDAVKRRENFIKDASKLIWEDIRANITEGLDNGESNAKLAARIREKFTGLSKHRSETIAQTETGIAYGYARQRAMAETGIPFKEWLTARDDKVRAQHVSADKQRVPVSDPFIIDGESLMSPGDPSGSAENVINCRCVAVARRTKE